MGKLRKRLKKAKAYPDATLGSKLAAEARKMSNSLSEEQRADYLKRAMAMIYGSSGKKAVRSRR